MRSTVLIAVGLAAAFGGGLATGRAWSDRAAEPVESGPPNVLSAAEAAAAAQATEEAAAWRAGLAAAQADLHTNAERALAVTVVTRPADMDYAAIAQGATTEVNLYAADNMPIPPAIPDTGIPPAAGSAPTGGDL